MPETKTNQAPTANVNTQSGPTPNVKPVNKWDKKELGVLWKRTKMQTGEVYLTGTLNLKSLGFDKDVPLVVFSNKNKTADRHPDLRIYLSERTNVLSPPATPALVQPPQSKESVPDLPQEKENINPNDLL